LQYSDQLKKDVDKQKVYFREAAASAVDASSGVLSLEFVDGKGGAINVTLPDVAKAGNRKVLSAEKIAQAAESIPGIEDMTETTETFVLSGEWISWLKTVMSTWEKDGVAMPDGLEHKVVTKLTEEGIAKLRAVEGNNSAAADLLKSAVNAATIKLGG
jgi:hypothetical protein